MFRFVSHAIGRGVLAAVALAGLVVVGVGSPAQAAYSPTDPVGYNWATSTSAADNSWGSVTYGNGMFVAVAFSGTGNRVMTSPDGINWTARTSAADNDWTSVTYGNGLFVAVASSGTGNRVMTSPNGTTWTARTSAADNAWTSVTYGNGLFVAVANSGTGDRVMRSNGLFLTQNGDVLQVVTPTGSAPTNYRIGYNTTARKTANANWGVWGWDWPTGQRNAQGIVPINLATYQNAGSCSSLGMLASNCPRPAAIGTQGSGQTLWYRVGINNAGTWQYAERQVTHP